MITICFGRVPGPHKESATTIPTLLQRGGEIPHQKLFFSPFNNNLTHFRRPSCSPRYDRRVNKSTGRERACIFLPVGWLENTGVKIQYMRLTEDGEGHEEQQQVEREFGHGRTRGSTREQNSAADQNFSSSSSGAETGSGRHHCTDCESGSGGAEQHHLRSRLHAPAQPPPPLALSLSTDRSPATRSVLI